MPNDPYNTFTADAIPPPEAVTARTYCRHVTICENGDATQDYQVRRVSATSNPIKRFAGTSFTFVAPDGLLGFKPGDVVGYVETLAGSATFAQWEEP